MVKPRIMFVAIQNSIHTVRWIKQLSASNFTIYLFPINYYPPHPELPEVILYQPPNVPPLVRHVYLGLRRRYKKYINKDEHNACDLSARTLAAFIRKHKPDLVHSLEFQGAGYLMLKAQKYLPRKIIWLASNWGSDIYYFHRFANHATKIRELLQQIDYYGTECERDLKLAHELGFKGKTLPVVPNSGGFDPAIIHRFGTILAPAKRHLIMIKGYESFAGRALTALQVIKNCRELLTGFSIVIFSASPIILPMIAELDALPELDITILPPMTPHHKMLKYFGRARIYLGISISDGISTAMLEAMAMGAFPIQTHTSCCQEWLEHGVNGLIISPDDPEAIESSFSRALTDDDLVNQAAIINQNIITERLNTDKITHKVINAYQSILERHAN